MIWVILKSLDKVMMGIFPRVFGTCKGWQELLHAEACERHLHYASYGKPFLFVSWFSWAVFSENPMGFMTLPWKQQWGENCRFYHAFQCEDFVGRLTDIAACCHKSKLEEAVLKRFYMGLFHHHQCLANEDDISSDWSILVSQGEKVSLPVWLGFRT